jgi:hypothetical protein
VPTFAGNLFAHTSCSPTDRQGTPTWASSDYRAPDFHLQRGSLGIGGGDARLYPAIDIDGKVRPRRFRPDAGASQREAASVIPGRSIGEVTLGETEADVTSFYGSPRRIRRLRDHGVRVAAYRVHRGELLVAYHGQAVVGVGTTTAFYSSSAGLAVGAKTSAPVRRSPWVSCRNAYRLSANHSALFVGIRRPGAAKVTRIWLVKPGFQGCNGPGS